MHVALYVMFWGQMDPVWRDKVTLTRHCAKAGKPEVTVAKVPKKVVVSKCAMNALLSIPHASGVVMEPVAPDSSTFDASMVPTSRRITPPAPSGGLNETRLEKRFEI